ncbi:hypothetical protein [uncultured Clostridium sp.]|uniref:hypothetical protein n=1 Tax=uncultured Clostridium sp. TaxID=59620 RepID=UPI0026131AE1|nr:hypothetical protein [uncultured Clostridium sp.]
MLISKFRDLVLMEVSEGKVLTIACDSCGGIGNSENDVVKVDEEIVGYLTTRVCMFETLSYRALPKVIINNLCVEMNGRGEKILKGIHRAMDEFNSLNFERKLTEDNLTGSTEDNIPVMQTSFGVTVIGEEGEGERLWEIDKDDYIVGIGIPLVGDAVIKAMNEETDEMISMKSLKIVLDYSKDVIPVGSKGIDYELSVLEETNGIDIEKVKDLAFDCKASAGPSTMVLAIVSKEMIGKITRRIDERVTKIGRVKILK